MKNALITGITGQDGSYLAELLLEKGYNVYGIMRRKSVVDYGNVEHIKDKIHFIYADMTDVISLINAMRISQADEVYNLAAQSFVATSWEQPIATADIDAIGVTNMLEAIRTVKPLLISIRLLPVRCSDWFRRCLRQRKLHFTQEAPTVLPSCTVTGLLRITVRATDFMRAAVSCLTMRVSAGARSLLPERSQMQLQESSRAFRSIWSWEIWIPSVTGVILRTMSAPCG